MGSYSELRVDGLVVGTYKAPLHPSLLLLFSSGDRRESTLPSDPELDPDELRHQIELAVSAAAMRDRLDVLGVGRAATSVALQKLIRSELEYHEEDHLFEGAQRRVIQQNRRERSMLERLDFDVWTHRVANEYRRQRRSSSNRVVGSLTWLLELVTDNLDTAYCLRAVLEAFPDAREVVLDISDPEMSGYDESNSPLEYAQGSFSWEAAHGAPVILLTEGRSDARILSIAIELKPHLVGRLRVADFVEARESNAGALVNIVKTFAASGVANRVVAIFDHDTAANEALSSLNRPSLPPNLFIFTLPPLDLARSYPTLGPGGLAHMDVNGLATSLELYLGRDVLEAPDGQLQPVEWRALSRKLGRYQGVIADKEGVQDAFQRKAEAALKDRSIMANQDWSGLELLLRCLLDLLANEQ
jgi:hypothetical protein